jgi:hypothetical protein
MKISYKSTFRELLEDQKKKIDLHIFKNKPNQKFKNYFSKLSYRCS